MSRRIPVVRCLSLLSFCFSVALACSGQDMESSKSTPTAPPAGSEQVPLASPTPVVPQLAGVTEGTGNNDACRLRHVDVGPGYFSEAGIDTNLFPNATGEVRVVVLFTDFPDGEALQSTSSTMIDHV